MMRRRLRNVTAMVLAAWLPTLNACYTYVPLATAAPPTNELVSLDINDQGRVALNERLGQGVSEIVGRVTQQQGNELTVSVSSVKQLTGETTQWTGELVRIDRASIGQIKRRQFSSGRTTAVVVIAAVGVGLLLANTALGGVFSGSDEPSVGPDPKPSSVRIPIVP